jgi:hypothetical protein
MASAKNTNKTQETKASVPAYVAAIKDAGRRNDVQTVIDLFTKELKMEPKMWGPSIVGFGSYHYVYDSGREGDAPLVGLSSRADSISLYLSSSFKEREELLAKLGKHKTAKACVYVKSVKEIDLKVLAKMAKLSAAHTKKMHS